MIFLVILLAAVGFFLLLCKLEYDSQESLEDLEKSLRVGKWSHANMATENLIMLMIYRYSRGIPCVRYKKKKDDIIGFLLWKYINKRQEEKLGIRVSVGSDDFSTEDIDKFPMDKLQAIDKLWVKYSKGKYGFSVQASIYDSHGKTRHRSIRNYEIYVEADKGNANAIRIGQVKSWGGRSRGALLDYLEKYEKDILLRLGWMRPQRGYPPEYWCFRSDDYEPGMTGMCPCHLSSSLFANPMCFLFWRKMLRGSAID